MGAEIKLPRRALSVADYRDPGPEGYGMELSPARDAIISPQLRPDVAISLAEVWLVRSD